MLLQSVCSKHALNVLVGNIKANMKSICHGFCSLQNLRLALSISLGLEDVFKKHFIKSCCLLSKTTA